MLNPVLIKQCDIQAMVQLAYAIGVAEPVSVLVETFGTAKKGLTEDEISRRVRANFDLTPRGIIQLLELTRPVYSQTAKNGHFGHPEFGWGKTGLAHQPA